MIKGWKETAIESLGTGAQGGKALFTFLLFYPFTLLPLFMVVRFPFYNSTCAIERLGKDKAHHLMREVILEREIFSLARS